MQIVNTSIPFRRTITVALNVSEKDASDFTEDPYLISNSEEQNTSRVFINSSGISHLLHLYLIEYSDAIKMPTDWERNQRLCLQTSAVQ